MMASRYGPQIFCVLAAALAYTLLALPTAKKKSKSDFFQEVKRSWQVEEFCERIPTHNSLNWVDSTKHCFQDIHHCSVPQDGLLKHCQEVLMERNRLPIIIFQQTH